MKVFFKGTSGIEKPVDINGVEIKAGDLLTWDFGDYESYMHKPIEEKRKHDPFFLVEQHSSGKGLFAESIFPCMGYYDKKFYLHDFRFKYCKVIKVTHE